MSDWRFFVQVMLFRFGKTNTLSVVWIGPSTIFDSFSPAMRLVLSSSKLSTTYIVATSANLRLRSHLSDNADILAMISLSDR